MYLIMSLILFGCGCTTKNIEFFYLAAIYGVVQSIQSMVAVYVKKYSIKKSETTVFKID